LSLSILFSRAQLALEAPLVTVEVHLTGGLPATAIVGLPETAVRESKDRVRSAILSSGFEFPNRKIIVNLGPADLPKEGGRFDLAIALGILAASRQVSHDVLGAYEFLGELALDGSLRPVRAVLPAALRCRDDARGLIVTAASAPVAAMADGARVHGARHLLEVCAHLARESKLPLEPRRTPRGAGHGARDLAEVRGQHRARRALEVAAAGEHNLLLIGPPGSGKTMLASRLPGILPPMTEAEALESAAIHSTSTLGFDPAAWGRRPFRAPHHTASAVALVGGGGVPRPGEVSLAHHGVLFLDELPEFERRVLEVLREPLESGRLTVSRAARQCEFPARFQLVAAMNPCPCGHLGDGTDRCRCTEDRISRYRARVSGPLLDRVDLHVEVPRVKLAALGAGAHDGVEASGGDGEGSDAVRSRVARARTRQLARAGKPNARFAPAELRRWCRLAASQQSLLERAAERLALSARATHRVLKVARTIADLGGSDEITAAHLAEAIGYRALDRGSGAPGTAA